MKADLSSGFPAALSSLVKEHGSQSEMARRIGVTPSHISQLCRGCYRPSRDVIERLIEEYGLDREQWLELAGFKLYQRKSASHVELSAIHDAVTKTIKVFQMPSKHGMSTWQASGSTGWACPKCGCVWAPGWPECSRCNSKKHSREEDEA